MRFGYYMQAFSRQMTRLEFIATVTEISGLLIGSHAVYFAN